MPGCARKDIVREGEIGVYHAWSRCVQRAFLCGQDPLTGQDYDYRREWIQKLLEYLAGVFAVDVGNYSILHNHEHLIARTRPDIAAGWSDEEVAWRWKCAWPRWEEGAWSRSPTDEEIELLLADPSHVAAARKHLSSLSWLMARWKEPISRLANQEMNRRGHFWEQRFGARELVDEAALLTCSIYVDVNQVKAGIARSLDQSHYSAIQDRIRAWRQREAQASLEKFQAAHGEDYELKADDLHRLLSDCFLAPIQADGPLLLAGQAMRAEPAVRVAAGGPDAPSPGQGGQEQQADCQAGQATEEADRQDEAARPGAETAAGQSPGRRAQSQRRSGWRRHRPAQWKIHQRLRERQRRRASDHALLDMPLAQYLEIAQWAAEQAAAGRDSPLPDRLAPALGRLAIDPDCWLKAVRHFDAWFGLAAGKAERLAPILARTGRRWLQGVRRCRDVFT